jgi:exodeoxyribonuclease V alpha subunit
MKVPPTVEATLEAWVRQGWLRELDRSFADFVAGPSALALQAPVSEPLQLAAALASHQLGRGHPGLDLAEVLSDPEGTLGLPPPDDDARPAAAAARARLPGPAELVRALGLDAAGWADALRPSPAVGDGPGTTPLVLVGTRLALRRYWQHEQTVAAAIEARVRPAPEPVAPIRESHPQRPVFSPSPLAGEGSGRGGNPETSAPSPLAGEGQRDRGEGSRTLAPRSVFPGLQSVAPVSLQGSHPGPSLAAAPVAAVAPTLLPDLDAPAGQAALRAALDLLFPPPRAGAAEGPDWQKIACAVAARSRFAIVTGGPGTGKTTTVVKLLALLQHLALQHGGGRPLRVRMAAPTGKAAARLNASVAQAVQRLPLAALVAGGDAQALRAAIPTAVVTLHRLLGARPDTRRLAHDARHPLPLDLLVIDEASMVDLELMARTCAALRPGARLVLLGDKDQLAAVEAGAVLGGLCARADVGHHRPAQADWLLAATGERVPPSFVDPAGQPLDQAVVALRHSHRFDPAGGIGRLAAAVNRGDAEGVRAVLAATPPDLACVRLPGAARREGGAPAGSTAPPGAWRSLLLDGACEAFPGAGLDRSDRGRAVLPPVGYRHYLQQMRALQPAAGSAQAALDAWALAVLQAFGAFQLLCALRRGEFGVEALNARTAALLQREGLIPTAEGWYAGRPVMVTRNDHALGLMNGDVGIALAVSDPAAAAAPGAAAAASRLRVAFPASDGGAGVRWVAPSRLQAVETAYAMTVHKSQGSEFAHAALLLPERAGPVLTRELVYTAVTRASHWFTLALPAGAEEVLDEAVARRVRV